ncbi:MAG: Gx transporter family protein [Clostridiales bacterium]|nr:Gx transporter family protein [Clostridiales bacterium]
MRQNKIIAWMAILVALAFVLSFLERMVSFEIPVPGVKLGLANLAVLMALYTIGAKGAAVVCIIRIFLDGMTFGNAYRMMYSLAGGLLSFFIMYIGKRCKWSVMSVSMAGGLCHNIGQIIVAIIILKTPELVTYLPVLILAGIATGAINGGLCGIIMKSFRRIKIE